MKFAIAKEHRDFFNKHHAVELEGFFSTEQIQSLKSSLDATLAARLKISVRELKTQHPEALFAAGRDVWRTNEAVQKFVTQKNLAEIASELTNSQVMRLGMDQYFLTLNNKIYQAEDPAYNQLIHFPHHLEEITCLQGALCGLMIALEDMPEGHDDASESKSEFSPVTIFPKKSGNVIYFDKETLLDWRPLSQQIQTRYLMIVYVQLISVYVNNPQDPNLHSLKQYGYVFGDRLSDKKNPIVYR